jgi:hypothetical protein
MVSIISVHGLFVELRVVSTIMSETFEKATASLQIQQEVSKKIVGMTHQLTVMTDLTTEANRAYETLSEILLTFSSLSIWATQVDELSVGIQKLEAASQSTHKTDSMVSSNQA